MKLLSISSLLLLVQQVNTQPSNDECIDATIIPFTAESFPYTDTTPSFSDATYNRDNITSECIFSQPTGNVWYSFESSISGVFDFSTLGSTYIAWNGDITQADTYISIFEGDDCGVLEMVVCGTEYHGGIEIVEGKKYFVEIGSDYPVDSSFDVVFTISKSPLPPLNDECVDAIIIPQTNTFPYSTQAVTLTQATFNPSDSGTCYENNYENVWYLFTPPVSGLYDFTIIGSKYISGLDASAFIGIFKGASCTSLEQIKCDSRTLALVSLDVGVTYYVMVQAIYGRQLSTNLTLTVNPSPPIPTNDECINAITIDPFAGLQYTGDTSSASLDTVYVSVSFDPTFYSGVWYKVTNPSPNIIPIIASTCYSGTLFNTQINVFKGDNCDNLVFVDQDGYFPGCGLSSKLTFIAAPFSSYYILVNTYDGYDDIHDEDAGGNYTLTIDGITNYFGVVDSKTDNIIDSIDSEFSYRNNALTSSSLNIEAVFTNQTSIQSVRVTFDNPKVSRCENKAPYAVFGDNNGDFRNATIPEGTHTVTATSYTRQGCKGRSGVSMSKTFNVIGCKLYFYAYCGGIDDTSIPFINNDVISSECTGNIRLLAYCGFKTNQVIFDLRNSTSIVYTKVEKVAPYFLFGNTGNIINKQNIAPGEYNLTVTIDGIKHDSIHFTIIDP